MGKLRKIGKKVKRGFSKIGKKLKKGLGKIAKAFGKLGPLGSIALSFILPGMGSVLQGWLSNMGPVGEFILGIGKKIQQGANWVKDGVGRVFNRATDAIEYGMNKVSSIGGQGTAGSDFRNWVSEQTNGFIDKSTVGLEDKIIPGGQGTILNPDGTKTTFQRKDTVLTPDQQVGNFKNAPKIPQTPKNMVDPVYVDGLDTDLKKGFYEQADLDTYYKGVDTPVGDYTKMGIKSPTGEPMKGFTNVQPADITAGKSTDLAGANIYGEGPPKPIRAVDSTTIKTTGDLKAPKPEGSGYFSKVKKAYKVLGPVGVIGGKMLADESDAAYSDYLMRVDNASRANIIANETLSVVPTNTYTYAPQEFININNLDNDSNGMQRLAAGYGMILEDYTS